MRTSYQSTTSRPSPSGRTLREGGGPGGLPQRPLLEEARHRGRGSRARRAETPRRDLPDGCHRALPQARDLGRGDHRRDVPGGRLNQEDRGRLRAPLGGAGVHREDGARRVRRDVCLHGIPTGALAPDQDEQRNRAHRPRDQEEDEAVGTYPDGNSAVMLVSARLNYIAKHEWGKRRYLDMSKLEETDELKGKAEGWKRTGPRTAI